MVSTKKHQDQSNMHFGLFWGLLISSYKNSKFGLIMLLTSLIIAVSGLSSVLIINDSAKQSYSANNTLLVPNVSFQVIARSPNEGISKADYARLRKLGFSNLIAVARTREHIYSLAPQDTQHTRITQRRIDFTGIDTFALIANNNVGNNDAQSQNGNSVNQNTSANLIGLSFAEPIGLLHPSLLNALTKGYPQTQLAIQKLNIASDLPNKYIGLPKLVATQEGSLGNDIIMDMALFSQLFEDTPLIGLLWIQNPSDINFDSLQNELKANLPAHLTLVALSSTNEQGELTQSFHLNLLAMALLMFVVCLFIVLNAVNLLINSRMAWLKICRQLGIPRKTMFAVQLIEISVITLLAVVIGIILGIYLSNIVAPSVQATLEGLYSVQVGFGQVSLISLFLQVLAISLIGSIAAVFIPFKQVDNALAQSGKVNTSTDNNQNKRKGKSNLFMRISPFWGIGTAFAICAIILLNFTSELWLLLLATACLILAGCAILLANYPLALRTLSSLIPSNYPLLQVSTKQSIVLSGKTKIACCAFFIAATSNIGMNLMVDSFRGATVSWLDSRLASDYYFYYRGAQDISQVSKQAGVTFTQRLENNVTYQGKKVQQYSYPTSERFKQAMVFYDVNNELDAWEAFSSNSAAFVNQQFAFYFGLGLGDTIKLPHPDTEIPTSYQIAGIIYDFGNPNKQVLLPSNSFSSERSTSSIYALEANSEQIKKFKVELEKLEITYAETLIKTEQLFAISMEAFDNTFVITDGLNIVTLLVAALSLACAIIVLMDDVRPQNMLIRSLGVSALKTQALALFQYLLLCLVALMLATPFGILLSWVLIFDINYQAFNWTYPLLINPMKILQIYALSIVVVFTVIAIPLLRASRKPLIEDIRWLN